MRSAVFGLHFGARCVERRSWGRFRCMVRLFGFDFGALLFRDRFWCVVRWCWGQSQPAGNKIYPDWRGPEPETCRIWGLWPWRMMPFWVDFGARCAFSGSVLVRGAPILGPISVRGASFLGSLLVRGAPFLGCADFRADFGARCAFLCSQDWRGPGGNRARDLSNMGPWSWRMMPFRMDFVGFGVRCAVFEVDFGARCAVFGLDFGVGMWCADFGADFGARCVVFGLDFGARCAVFGCFWARFWCAVCGAPILRPISVHGVPSKSFLVRGAPFLVSILVHGVWCADFGANFVARCTFLGSILARCLFGIEFGIDFGAWCADVGVNHSQRATRSIKTWAFCFLALCWAPLSWPQNVVTTLFKTIASFLHA